MWSGPVEEASDIAEEIGRAVTWANSRELGDEGPG